MNRVLVVEDDVSLGEILVERLSREFVVDWAKTLQEAATYFANCDYQIVLLDVTLPDGTGFEFATSTVKPKGVPFIFMTALNSAEHRLEGYEIGAEEYIPKPFHLKELMLRVRHVLENHAPKAELLVGDRVIDFLKQAVRFSDGREEFLQARDFHLLKLLVENSPRVMSRDEILDLIWGEDKFPSHRTVDNAIVRLRQVLGDDGGQLIRSVRGVGYQWVLGS